MRLPAPKSGESDDGEDYREECQQTFHGVRASLLGKPTPRGVGLLHEIALELIH